MRKKSVGRPKTSQDHHQKNLLKLNPDSTFRSIPSLVDEDPYVGACNDEFGKTLPESSIEDREMLHGAGVLRPCSRKHEKMLWGDCEYVNFLERETCVGCNQGGDVLVCSGKDCPVSLHEKCIGCGPRYDGLGNFYCPYCWYKMLVSQARELRTKAMLAKENLSNFLNEKLFFGSQAKQGDKISEIQNLDRPRPKENGDSIDHDINNAGDGVQDEVMHVKKDQQNENNTTELTSEDQQIPGAEGGKKQYTTLHNADNNMHCSENASVCIELEQEFISTEVFNEPANSKANLSELVEDGTGIEEDPGSHPENEQETDFGSVVKAEPLAAYYLGEDKCFHSLYSLLDGNGSVSGNEQFLKEGGEEIHREVMVHENDNDEDSPVDYHTNDLPRMRRLVKHKTQKKLHRSWDQNKELIRSGESSQNTSERGGKRKRLNWTAEEEDKLREGVPRFTTANRNIPWRKILEYGRQVFDMSRTPVDLKDKWRNMMAKENPSPCD